MGISTQFRAIGEKSDTVEIASSKLSLSPDTIDVNKHSNHQDTKFHQFLDEIENHMKK